jgi:hypothetical protein
MNLIRVPAPPKEAFHKIRPISGLVKAQVNHFKHLEEKIPPEQREAIPKHWITTENDAALYIAAMTHLLRSGSAAAPEMQKTVTIKRSSRPKTGKTARKPTSKPRPKREPSSIEVI